MCMEKDIYLLKLPSPLFKSLFFDPSLIDDHSKPIMQLPMPISTSFLGQAWASVCRLGLGPDLTGLEP